MRTERTDATSIATTAAAVLVTASAPEKRPAFVPKNNTRPDASNGDSRNPLTPATADRINKASI